MWQRGDFGLSVSRDAFERKTWFLFKFWYCRIQYVQMAFVIIAWRCLYPYWRRNTENFVRYIGHGGFLYKVWGFSGISERTRLRRCCFFTCGSDFQKTGGRRKPYIQRNKRKSKWRERYPRWWKSGSYKEKRTFGSCGYLFAKLWFAGFVCWHSESLGKKWCGFNECSRHNKRKRKYAVWTG